MGSLAVRRANILAIYSATAEGRYPPPEDIVPDQPAHLRQTIRACLAADRDHRLADCACIIRLLSQQAPSVAPPPTRSAATWTPAPPRPAEVATVLRAQPAPTDVQPPARSSAERWARPGLVALACVVLAIALFAGIEHGGNKPATDPPATRPSATDPSAAADTPIDPASVLLATPSASPAPEEPVGPAPAPAAQPAPVHPAPAIPGSKASGPAGPQETASQVTAPPAVESSR